MQEGKKKTFGGFGFENIRYNIMLYYNSIIIVIWSTYLKPVFEVLKMNSL